MTTLELDHVTVEISGRAVLEDVSLRLGASDFIVVLGPNGAGKTTLVRSALGLVKPAGGQLTLDGAPVASLPARVRAAKIAWLPQRGLLVEPTTALDAVAMARFRFREARAASREAAKRALATVHAEAIEERLITELSGGELQRVAFAALLAQEAPLILLDEPASHLDPAYQIELYALVGRLWRSGLGVLCITHDINALAHAVGDEEAARVQIVGLKRGRVDFVARYGDPDLDDRLGALFGIHMASVGVRGRRLFVPEPARSVPEP
jgi:iron complex transport system ATP-binding protein